MHEAYHDQCEDARDKHTNRESNRLVTRRNIDSRTDKSTVDKHLHILGRAQNTKHRCFNMLWNQF
jgi:hypothetical protein